jgi:hypothetical protein
MKTAGKNSGMVGNFPQWEKKRLPLHGSFSTAAPVVRPGFIYPFCISVVMEISSTFTMEIANCFKIFVIGFPLPRMEIPNIFIFVQ